MKDALKSITPPVLIQLAKRLKSKGPGPEVDHQQTENELVEWEYVPAGWSAATSDSKIKGWNVESVLAVYRDKWPAFVKQLEGTHPYRVAPGSEWSSQKDS